MNIAEGAFVVLGLVYLYVSRNMGDNTPSLVKLIGRLAWAAFLICMGCETLLPILFSPRASITGQVYGLHRVHAGRGYYYFEFDVVGQNTRQTVRADYSDHEFYSGDPILSNGNTVEARYLQLTGETEQLRELAGRHPGWEYQADTKPIAPPIFILIGLAVLVGAVAGFITDIQARPGKDADAKPISVLGL